MRTLTIYCRHCGGGYVVRDTDRLPAVCPHEACGQVAHWQSESPVPIRPYALSANDRAWLKKVRIDPQ